MSNEKKKYVGLETLQTFLDGCKSIFASITHKHKLSDITDYTVDEALSDSSANPVQNKVINAEFDAVADAMGALEQAIDGKSDSTHNHDSAYDAKGSSDIALDSAKTYTDNAVTNVKNDLLNGAGDAYDTLKELGDLIDENQDAIEALETIAAGKADKEHVHDIYETKEDAQLKYDEIINIKADSKDLEDAILRISKNEEIINSMSAVTQVELRSLFS